MADVVITEFMDAPSREALASRLDVHFDPSLHEAGTALAPLLGDCRALVVRNRTQVRDTLLSHAPVLEVVGRLGVGLDNIDVEACERRGITVIPATGANTDSVAEYVVAAALLLLRGAYAFTDAILNGEWPREACVGREAQGATLGLVGFGAIGRATAARALGLGMRVAAFDPALAPGDAIWRDCGAGRAASLRELLPQCDVVSLHVPLIDSTRNLIDADALAAMKPGAVLVNTARGGIVDEAALGEALRSGKLGGAAVDVFEREPPGASSSLRDAPNLLLTPHIAGVTVESNRRVGDTIARAVIERLGNRGE